MAKVLDFPIRLIYNIALVVLWVVALVLLTIWNIIDWLSDWHHG